MGNVKLIASIQHTGTWFLIDLLRNHPEVKDFWLEKDFDKIDEENISLIHTHMHLLNNEIFDQVKNKIDSYQTIIPVRDPMKSLITRHKRHPELDHSSIVYGFECISKLENVFFFPIDVYKRKSDRNKLIIDAFSFLGLSRPNVYIRRFARAWKPRRSTSKRSKIDLDKAYSNGQMDVIKNAMPEEYEILKDKEYIIRPFLESLGYKDLSWWSK